MKAQYQQILPVQIINVYMAQDHMPEEQKRSPHQDQQILRIQHRSNINIMGATTPLQQGLIHWTDSQRGMVIGHPSLRRQNNMNNEMNIIQSIWASFEYLSLFLYPSFFGGMEKKNKVLE